MEGDIGHNQQGRLSALSESLSEKKVVRLAAIAAVLIYLTSVATSWTPTPDSALYLMLGDNLASGEGYTLWGVPHAHVPPGYPVMLATLQWLGLGEMVWLNLAMVLVTLATGWFVFAVLSEQVGRRLAILVVLALALNHTVHLVGTRILSDLPYMLTMWAGLWCYLRGLRSPQHRGSWLTVGTVLFLLSCGIRVAGIPIALSAALGLALQGRFEGKRTWIHLAAMFLIIVGLGVVAWGYYRTLSAGGEVPSYLATSSSILQRSLLDWIVQPMLHFLQTGQSLAILFTAQEHAALGLAVAVLWVPTLIGLALAVRRGQYIGACITAGYLLAVLLKRPLLPRYLLPLAPLLFIYYFQGLRWLVELRLAWKPYGYRVALVSLGFCAALNAPRTLINVYQIHATRGADSKLALKDQQEVARFLSTQAAQGEKFIGNREERIISYLSGVPSIASVRNKLTHKQITQASLTRWKDQDVRFVVNCGKSPTIDRRIDQASENGSRVVFENENYRILAIQPPSGTPEIAKANDDADRR